MLKNKSLGLVVTFVFVVFLAWLLIHDAKVSNAPVATDGDTTSIQGQTTVGARERCGGNMSTAAECDTTSHCAPVPGSTLPFGDVGGVCVKN